MRSFLHAQGPTTSEPVSPFDTPGESLTPADIQLVSLFSGAGGLDQGFREVGCQPRIAFDFEAAATRTYRANFPDAAVHLLDLACTPAQEIIDYVRQSVDCSKPLVLLGGPPCQSFSRSNVTTKANDPRSDLPGKYAEIVNVLHESLPLVAFVFENVPDLRLYRKNRHRYAQLIRSLRRGRFKTSEYLLNALDYGVPQNRTRLFLVGLSTSRFGRVPVHLTPNTSGQRRTVRDTIYGFPEPRYFRRGLDASAIPFHPNHWTMVPRSEKFKREKEPPNVKRRSFKRLYWDEPSPAVAYGNREIHVHPNGHRRLSIYEAMRLQGFPETFRIEGTLSDQVTQISNAVAPPVAAALASSLVGKLIARFALRVRPENE